MFQRALAVVVGLALLAGGTAYAYRLLAPPAQEQAAGPQYATAEVRRGDISVGVTVRGILRPTQNGWLRVPWPRGPFRGRPPENFTVVDVLAQEGDVVEKDEAIVRLNAQELESSLQQAESELQQKRQNLAERLGISLEELDQINPARGITLRAPLSGRLTGLDIDEGDEVQQGKPVARVVNDSRWAMTVHLAPAELEQVQVGSPAVVRFSEFDGLVEARVVEVNPNRIPTSGEVLQDCRGFGNDGAEGVRFVHRARIEGENPGLILPGMIGRIGLPPAGGATEDADPAPGSIRWLRYCASVEGYADEESVISTATGIVTRLYARDMQMVERGDPILSLSGDTTQQAIEQDLEEIRRLETELQGLRSFVGELLVRAPIGGVVSELEVEPGQTIRIGEALGNIYSPQQMQMVVQVDDVDVLLVKQGAPVEVTLEALPDEVFPGEVVWVSPSGRDESGFSFFQVRIEVEGGPRMRPGMQAQAYIEAGQSEDTLLVPLEAVFQEGRQYKVEVLADDGTTRLEPVEVGLMNEFEAEILSGLEEGQQVVVGSSQDLLPSREVPDTLLPAPGEEPSREGDGGDEEGTRTPSPREPEAPAPEVPPSPGGSSGESEAPREP